MTFGKMSAAIGILVILSASVASAQEKRGEMIVASYADLKREIVKHRGKVVLVDFWAGY